MRESMARLTPALSTNRTVRQYPEEHYLRAASANTTRAACEGGIGASLLQWKADLRAHWPSLRFGAATVERQEGHDYYQVEVFLDDLDPRCVNVELFAEGKDSHVGERHTMERGERFLGTVKGYTYAVHIPARRPAADFTPRVIPFHKDASVPLEASYIPWHDSPSWRSWPTELAEVKGRLSPAPNIPI